LSGGFIPMVLKETQLCEHKEETKTRQWFSF